MKNTSALMGKLFLFFVCSICSAHVFGQSGTVKGTVKNNSGQILVGATIKVAERNTTVISDAAGNFNITLPIGTFTLNTSYVGTNVEKTKVIITSGQTTVVAVVLTEVLQENEVVVVGSRNKFPRSSIATAVPVDIVQMKEIKNYAQADLTQLLTYIAPSFQSARQTISDGTDHIDPSGLRGLGPDQTLILLNGKRRHNTALVNINGTVGRGSVGTDLNAIPVAAIERVEILRDGAAAQYGTDAIAGVINVVLKKNYKGLNISAMNGQNFTNMPYNGGTSIQDGLNQQIDAVGGFANKKFHLTASMQWLRRDATNRSGIDNIPLAYLGNGGAFPTAPTSVPTADFRKWLIDQDNTLANSRGYNRQNIVAGNSASTNLGGFINTGLKISDKTELYLSGGASRRKGNASGFSRNPNSWNQQPVNLDGNRFYSNGFLPEIHTNIVDQSVIAGLKTSFGEWSADFSNTFGTNNVEFNIKNTGNASLAPSNSVQTSFNAGTILFTQNSINIDLSRKYNLKNDATFNFATGLENRFEEYQIKAGELNSYNNGARQFAVPSITYTPTGQVVNIAGGPTAPGSQVFPGFQKSDEVIAKRNINSAYLDVEYQTKKLLIGGAFRYENYGEENSSYNGTGTKLTIKYDIDSKIAIRGSVSTGFRAPSLQQRYFQNQSTQFVAGLPTTVLTANNNNPIVKNAFGIQDLSPETSNSFTVGVVGKLSNNTSFTIDAYNININNRIVLSTQFSRSANPLVNGILNSAGIDASVSSVQFWTNAVNTRTRGIDIVVTQKYKLGKGNGNISLAANFNENKVVGGINTNSKIDDPINNPSVSDPTKDPAQDFKNLLFDRQQRSRIEVAQPNNKINLTATYNINKFNFMLRAVRFGQIQTVNIVDPRSTNSSGVLWNDVAFDVDQTFSAKITTDVVVTYRFYKSSTVSIGANNLLDVYPDRIFVDPRNNAAAVYANPIASALGATKTVGGYAAGRDLSNRERFLFPVNQFGLNGRFIFARMSLEIGDFFKK